MLRTIDKYGDILIQKISSPKGSTIGYQAIHKDMVGNAAAVSRYKTLVDCRIALGMPKPANSVMGNIPKAHCAQNQKGYRADNQRKAKS